MKFHLCALFVAAIVPAILAGDEIPSSLWESIRDKVGHGVAPSPHILKGEEAARHAFPHQVLLKVTLDYDYVVHCGGTLIHPEWVLTAAHCMDNVNRIDAILGAHNMTDKNETSRQTIKAARPFYSHENFLKQNTDIGLLKLEKPAVLNQFVQTIRLPAKSMKGKNLAGTQGEVSGWGRNDFAGGIMSTVLRFAHAKVISNEDCSKTSLGSNIKEWHMCTERAADTKGPCEGDSGSPVFITEKDGKRTIIGLVSFGDVKCQLPTVYTRVDYWLEWINKKSGIALRD